MTSEHIVKSFDTELGHLNQLVMRMGGLVEDQLAKMIEAVVREDAALAEEVVKIDPKVDAIEKEIDELAVRLLALRQPMAIDLRTITTALKISSNIERMGDYAANVAKRLAAIRPGAPKSAIHVIPRMGSLVQSMLKDVLDAYATHDADKAYAVWLRDGEVDELHNSLFRELLSYMMEDPRTITPCIHLLFIAKNVERIGDHATNVAEMVSFMVRGRPFHALRPKASDVPGVGDAGSGPGPAAGKDG